MEEKNEFSDLILDDQNSGNKAKKLLLNVIVIVIVILIAMVGYKIFSSDTTNQDDLNEQNLNANFIAPKDSNDDENAITIVKQDNGSFDDFKNNKLDDMEKISISEEGVYYPANQQTNNQKPTPAPTPKVEPVQETKSVVKIDPKPAPTPKVEPKKDIFDVVQAQKPTKQDISPVSKPKKQPDVQTSSGVQKGAYVQILAGDKLDLSSREVKNIKDKGFDFVIYKDPSTNKEKLLVGPHSGKELENKLNEVRAKVKKDAFIFRVK